MLVTKARIHHHEAPYGFIATIPAGTPVVPADNLPSIPGNPQYWVQPWPGMSEQAESWQRCYGFLVDSPMVIDTEADTAPELVARDSAGEETPMDVDGSGCEHVGWPGDGSGLDDLADMNANEADDYREE